MTNKLVKLEKLCRALQTERNSLSKNLRDIKRGTLNNLGKIQIQN